MSWTAVTARSEPDYDSISPEMSQRTLARTLSWSSTDGSERSRAASFDAAERGKHAAQSIEAQPTAARLRKFAERWPARLHVFEIRHAAGADAYMRYCSGEVCEDDAEQIAGDLDRSGVDKLFDLTPPDFTEHEHLGAISRVLRAFCVRTPNGYCQGMNFIVSVLLVVLSHAEWGSSARAAQSSAHLAPDGMDTDELAFWVFVAVMERLLPVDFYQLPSMAGLQCDVRVLMQLLKNEVPRIFDADIPKEDVVAVVKLAAYKCHAPHSTLARHAHIHALLVAAHPSRLIGPSTHQHARKLARRCIRWFVPCFINQLPLPTLLAYWDQLLMRLPPAAAGERSPLFGHSTAHLQLALALLQSSADDLIAILQAAAAYPFMADAAYPPWRRRTAASMLLCAHALAYPHARLPRSVTFAATLALIFSLCRFHTHRPSFYSACYRNIVMKAWESVLSF